MLYRRYPFSLHIEMKNDTMGRQNFIVFIEYGWYFCSSKTVSSGALSTFNFGA